MTSYNAVTWLLDRNIGEGRGAKLAYTDTVSDLTYSDLQQATCRAASCASRSLRAPRTCSVTHLVAPSASVAIWCARSAQAAGTSATSRTWGT